MSSSTPTAREQNGEAKWEPGHMLDVYVLDYLKKKDLQQTAGVFKVEARVPERPPAIDAPASFLYEWWSVFWDIFIARTNPTYSEAAMNYVEAQKAKQVSQQQLQLQQLQMQQMQFMAQRQLMRERSLGREVGLERNGQVDPLAKLPPHHPLAFKLQDEYRLRQHQQLQQALQGMSGGGIEDFKKPPLDTHAKAGALGAVPEQRRPPSLTALHAASARGEQPGQKSRPTVTGAEGQGQGLSSMSYPAPGGSMDRLLQGMGPGAWGAPGGSAALAQLGLSGLPGGAGAALGRVGPDGVAASPSQSAPPQVSQNKGATPAHQMQLLQQLRNLEQAHQPHGLGGMAPPSAPHALAALEAQRRSAHMLMLQSAAGGAPPGAAAFKGQVGGGLSGGGGGGTGPGGGPDALALAGLAGLGGLASAGPGALAPGPAALQQQQAAMFAQLQARQGQHTLLMAQRHSAPSGVGLGQAAMGTHQPQPSSSVLSGGSQGGAPARSGGQGGSEDGWLQTCAKQNQRGGQGRGGAARGSRGGRATPQAGRKRKIDSKASGGSQAPDTPTATNGGGLLGSDSLPNGDWPDAGTNNAVASVAAGPPPKIGAVQMALSSAFGTLPAGGPQPASPSTGGGPGQAGGLQAGQASALGTQGGGGAATHHMNGFIDPLDPAIFGEFGKQVGMDMLSLGAMEGNVDMFLGDHAEGDDDADKFLTAVDDLAMGTAAAPKPGGGGAAPRHDAPLPPPGLDPGVQN